MSNPAPQRRLDRKLTSILDGRYTPDDFVIADAKDADMAFGVAAPGPIPGAPAGAVGPGRYRTRTAYLDAMRALVQQGELDILLTSASNGEQPGRGRLAGPGHHPRGTGERHHRHLEPPGQRLPVAPSRPFRTADLAADTPVL